MRPSRSSVPIAVAMASPVRSHPSRIPNDRLAVTRIDVMRIGGRKRLSIVHRRPRRAGTCSAVDSTLASLAIGLFHLMPHVDRRTGDGLSFSRRPPDDYAIDRAGVTKPVVEPTLVLGTESSRRSHFLRLDVPVPVQLHPCADRAAI